MVRLMIPDGARFAPTQGPGMPDYLLDRPAWCVHGIEFTHNGSRWRVEMIEPGTDERNSRCWTFGDPVRGVGDSNADSFASDPEDFAIEYWGRGADPGTYRTSVIAGEYPNRALYRFVQID